MPTERELLIQSGASLTVEEVGQFCGFTPKFSGFEDLQFVGLNLTSPRYVRALLPGFSYDSRSCRASEAVCLITNGRPLMAIVKGTLYHDNADGSFDEIEITSLVNLAAEPEKVILASSETKLLNIGSANWPGYNLEKHELALKLGLEIISVAKRGDQFVISFPRR